MARQDDTDDDRGDDQTVNEPENGSHHGEARIEPEGEPRLAGHGSFGARVVVGELHRAAAGRRRLVEEHDLGYNPVAYGEQEADQEERGHDHEAEVMDVPAHSARHEDEN